MNADLTFTGGCYCGDVRYQCEGPPLMRGLYYYRMCRAISGGAGDLFMAVGAQGFQFTKDGPRSFNKQDRPGSPARHFCEACALSDLCVKAGFDLTNFSFLPSFCFGFVGLAG